MPPEKKSTGVLDGSNRIFGFDVHGQMQFWPSTMHFDARGVGRAGTRVMHGHRLLVCIVHTLWLGLCSSECARTDGFPVRWESDCRNPLHGGGGSRNRVLDPRRNGCSGWLQQAIRHCVSTAAFVLSGVDMLVIRQTC